MSAVNRIQNDSSDFDVIAQLELAITEDKMSIEVASAYRPAKVVQHSEPSSALDECCDSAR
jgi:hypothetical protein